MGLGLAAAALALTGAMLLPYAHQAARVAQVVPAPEPVEAVAHEGSARSGSAAAGEPGAAFPEVDWTYWQRVNPDVVAWLTVPGTRIDTPIVRARVDAPTFYLTHDVFGEASVFGCPYVDADCADGFDGMNCVVSGHHMADGSMFADFARFADPDYLESHAKVLLQGPGWQRTLYAIDAGAIRAGVAAKRTAFSGEGDYEAYVRDLLARLSARVTEPQQVPRRIVTFVTCSYEHEGDRTLVVAAD